jgi:hypothetical protein
VKALAIGCWVAAWLFVGLIPAAWFAAKNGERDIALAELAIGVAGAAGLALAGAALW